MKLASGAGSSNVRLVVDKEDALYWIKVMFGEGIRSSAGLERADRWRKHFLWSARLRRAVQDGVLGKRRRNASGTTQQGYILFQEYLEGNSYDTRVTIVGNRAFGFRRFNRKGDFRASGGGVIDYDPDSIDLRFVRLAFATATRAGTQSCAIDGLYRQKETVVGEISYTYVSEAVYRCPGHWLLDGPPETGTLTWRSGHMWPEEGQVEEFLKALEKRRADQGL